jgi:hypothetical protein
MGDKKKDEGAGYPIKILLEEALEKQRNAMMDNFAQILQRFPTGGICIQQPLWRRNPF